MSQPIPRKTDAYDFMVKVLILGDSAVGKTCILNRFCDDSFGPSAGLSTVGVDLKYKTLECQGKRVKLQIWDTAGQEKFRSIVNTYYKGALGIVLVYSINDKKSFINVESWLKQIANNAPTAAVVILVANKTDLTEQERIVKASDGEKLAELHNIQFIEVSAKTGEHIEETFLDLAKDIKDRILEDPKLLNMNQSTNTNQGPRVMKLDPHLKSQQRKSVTGPGAAPEKIDQKCKC